MQSMDRLFSVPTMNYLLLMKQTVTFLTAVSYCYAGMVMGSSLLSVIYNIRAAGKKDAILLGLSESLSKLGASHAGFACAVGFLPLFTLGFAHGITLFSSSLKTPWLICFSALIFLGALAALLCYNYTYRIRNRHFSLHIALGITGVLLLILASFTFTYGNWLTLQPEGKAPREVAGLLLNYLHFLSLSLVSTGVGILLFLHYLPSLKKAANPTSSSLVINLGTRLTASSCILQGVCGIFLIVTLPHPAPLGDNVGPQALIMLVTLAILIMLYRYELGFDVPLFLGLVLIFFSVARCYDVNRETALKKHMRQLVAFVREEESKRKGIAIESPVYKGSEIYKRICAACHAYDRRVVGPPFKEVLPKYAGDAQKLAEFVDNPRRINKNYPPMPRPALNYAQIEAVANYLLTDYLKEQKGAEK